MCTTNKIVIALLERMKSRNKGFLLSRPRFKKLFKLDTDCYLYGYGERLERHLLDKYGESADTFKYLDIFHFITDLLRLYYAPKKSNSEENEFGKLYAYGLLLYEDTLRVKVVVMELLPHYMFSYVIAQL